MSDGFIFFATNQLTRDAAETYSELKRAAVIANIMAFMDEIEMKRRALDARRFASEENCDGQTSQATAQDYRDPTRVSQSRAVKGERRSGMARPALQRETIDGCSSAPSAKDYRDFGHQDQGPSILAERAVLRRGPSRGRR